MGSLFSIVVPCYGHESYLRTAVESLWAQTNTDFEIVAIDDGSPDGTRALLESMAATSPRPMRVVSTVNRGAFAALNAGAELAIGKYLAFLNDDDAYHPERLEVFARASKSCDRFEWGFSAVEPMDERGVAIDPSLIPDITRRRAIQISHSPLEAVHALPRWNTAVSSGNFVVDRSLFHRIGGFKDLRFTHDWDLALRLLAQAAPFVAERALYSYRVHLGNAFAAQSEHAGARQADAESAQITRDHQRREEARSTFGPPTRPIQVLDPDEAWAIKGTLWTMAKLRSAPFFYTTVGRVVRRLRNLRRR